MLQWVIKSDILSLFSEHAANFRDIWSLKLAISVNICILKLSLATKTVYYIGINLYGAAVPSRMLDTF